MKKNLLVALFAVVALCWGSSKVYALDEVGGVYQIANADDLMEFSDMVAYGEGSLNAVLTDDIDLSGYDWLPIGTTSATYCGTFDGQEHRILNMVVNTEDEYQGLFGVISNGAHIKNIIIDSTCSIHGARFVGGIAGGSNGGGSITIENCGNEAEVTATEQNAAGIIGVSMSSSCAFIIRNCYNVGFVGGQRESAAISGWCGDNGSIVENCWSVSTISGQDGSNWLYRNGNTKGINNYCNYRGQGTYIDETEYTGMDGSLAYFVNGNQSTDVVWYQNIDGDETDLWPVPFKSHGVVYAVGTLNCDGTPASAEGFSNTNMSTPTPHNFYNGVCEVCGNTDMTYATQSGGYYELSTPEHLNWFAAAVNFGHNEIKGKLMNDIDFSKYTGMDVTIGKQTMRFKGAFDGQEHEVKVNYNCVHDTIALFRCIEDALIERLVVSGQVKTSRKFAAGLFAAGWGTNVIKNCIIKTNIDASAFEGDPWVNEEEGTSGTNYDATHGGLCCFAHGTCTITNCAVLGDLIGELSEGSAGIMGYPNGGGNVKISNCLVAGNFSLSNNNALITRPNGAKVENCYYVDNGFAFDFTEAEEVTTDLFATGELAYMLNGKVSGGTNWYQTIDSDDMPVPFASHKLVYQVGTLKCNGEPDAVTYTNTQGESVRPDHQYDADGVCSICGARLISTAEQLDEYALDLSVGAADANIDLTLANDIDMSSISGYMGVGTRDYPFMGNFDGKGHRILNMIIDAQMEGDGVGNNLGLFGVTSGNVTIKNVVIDSSCEILGNGYAAGIVGCCKDGGSLTIEHCGNEANVYVTGANAGGILGVNDLSRTKVTITNCYNTGEIVGGNESAGLSGWLGDGAVVTNCYNIGDVSGLDGEGRTFARHGSSPTFTNCYESVGSQVNTVTDEQITSGELCFLVNGKVSGGEVFFQTLGTDDHPIFDPTHGKVYEKNGTYTNTATAIEAVKTVNEANGKVEGIFSVNGARQNTLQRGVNIVKMSDGRVKKVIVK